MFWPCAQRAIEVAFAERVDVEFEWNNTLFRVQSSELAMLISTLSMSKTSILSERGSETKAEQTKWDELFVVGKFVRYKHDSSHKYEIVRSSHYHEGHWYVGIDVPLVDGGTAIIHVDVAQIEAC